MTANMYRIGDYVYFEASSTSPYQIRRIEELNKTPSGNVEAKVMCFYRRRDLPSPLIQLADKHQCALDEPNGSPVSDSSRSSEQLGPKQRHQMKHRELFLSRQVETLPATHIRGKCSVTLFNETEALSSYLNKDDMFFYCLVYDPTQKTLLADKGEIRVGSRYQCDIQSLLRDGEPDPRDLTETESLVWTPHHQLSDRQIDQFLVVSRSVGTFARALDCSSSVKQPSLHMSAAAASRDITLFHAMDTLHRHEYDLSGALGSLVPSSGPVLCRDEMEEWSASEANLFEEALDKYGKDFNDIRQDFLPWKTLKNIIEYYYMWKTTDRYVQQKRVKAVEAESKLKQVYIPNYNKPNPAALNNNKGVLNGSSNGSTDPAVSLGGKACESCNVTISSQWYAWGPSHMQCRLCQQCWSYWKKYGGLKIPTRFGDGADFENCGKKRSGSDGEDDKGMGHRPHRCNIGGCGKEFKLKAHLGRHYATAHGITVRAGSPRPVMKTRTAFYLLTTPLTRLSRRLCRQIMRPRHAARAPFFAINIQAVKQECTTQMVSSKGIYLEIFTLDINPFLCPGSSLNAPSAKRMTKEPISLTRHPTVPSIMPGGGVTAAAPAPLPTPLPLPLTVPSTPEQYQAMMAAAAAAQAQISPVPGPGPVPAVVPSPMPRHVAHVNGKPKIAQMTRGAGRKQVISWMDAPDDLYFRATDQSKKMRRQITLPELRRAARKPWRPLKTKADDPQVVVLD
ncbi:metastasis-associated protein MTA3 [Sitophilus oryzae]|uniref:Metastasis-associated protein MTA3 n=1 Tax=Sitophilus oryzae TaxID=7048 RepID=A0A6J2YJL0_SITOR|nr:metastasis-associated protein MTA3 [Sitophilus oryzae]